MTTAATRRAREALDQLYAALPTLDCQGKCAESCGPIAMSRVEWERMCASGGERHATSLDCPYLTDERCDVYAVRPTICRLWGMVDSMPCPWGCKPSRYLTREEGFDLLRRAGEIGA